MLVRREKLHDAVGQPIRSQHYEAQNLCEKMYETVLREGTVHGENEFADRLVECIEAGDEKTMLPFKHSFRRLKELQEDDALSHVGDEEEVICDG